MPWNNSSDRARVSVGHLLSGVGLVATVTVWAGGGMDRCLVPSAIRTPILEELSGELALQHVQILAVNRDREADEYLNSFLETTYLTERAKQYGLSSVETDYFPAGEIWDAEEAELWLVEPARKRLASLTMVSAAIAAGSADADIEAEVVYVGAGREVDYEGKDVKGKIVLGSDTVTRVFAEAVVKRGAVGALGTGSAGVSADSPGYSLDQIGWQSVRPTPEKQGFGFVLSLRQFYELRRIFEERVKVVMRARVRTKAHPYKMNVVSAVIPGTDPAAGELILIAHAFERIGTPGANDNCTGVATILEAGRTIARLIGEGRLAAPRRSIRFLWVPEISGTRAFLAKHTDLQHHLIAGLNFDMTGADLERTDTYLRMKMTPDSRPSYLNDLIANLLLFVDQTEIRTQTGNNAPFNYRLVPYISASDHAVLLDGDIPAMQFNHWPDNFYHSSEDRVVQVDPTELKRVGFMGAAAMYYLANAGATEAADLAWEASANGEKWMIEVARQSVRLLDAETTTLDQRYRAAQLKVAGAFNRARGGVESVRQLGGSDELTRLISELVRGLELVRDAQAAALKAVYEQRLVRLGLKPQPTTLGAEEQRYARMVPRKLLNPYTDEYIEQLGKVDGFLSKATPQLPRLAAAEALGFIDGTRSLLDVAQGVCAEYASVTTSSNEHKFAYVVTPGENDFDIETVVAYIQALEKAGLVEIRDTGR